MATGHITNRKDILLLLLYSPGVGEQVNEPVSGRTRLVKMLFLFQKEALQYFRRNTNINERNFYEFFPWNFGPFSSQVYDDLTFFTLQRFVEAKISEETPLAESAIEWEEWLDCSGVDTFAEETSEYEEEVFSLTDKGVSYTQEYLYPFLSSHQKMLLREFKKRSQAPLRALLRYVYENYPEFTVKSQIKGQVLGLLQ